MYNQDYLKTIYSEMNEYLATINTLVIKVKNLHYNVVGYEFFEVHEILDKYYEEISEEIDAVAERIRILDGFPDASMKVYLQKSKIQEIDSKAHKYNEVIDYLVKDFQTVITMSHKIIDTSNKADDAGTADLFTRTIQFYEKSVWMLKAFGTK